MRTRIYQINTERDENHLKFLPFQESPVDASVYDEVFNAELPTDNLEEVFRRFNMESHFLFRGHSLSVSDVVVNENGAFFCDAVGFKKIEFDEAKAQKQDNLMRVVYVEPHMPAYEAEIVDTLEGEQKAVGGYIEPVYLSDDICVIGNESPVRAFGHRILILFDMIIQIVFIAGLIEKTNVDGNAKVTGWVWALTLNCFQPCPVL